MKNQLHWMSFSSLSTPFLWRSCDLWMVFGFAARWWWWSITKYIFNKNWTITFTWKWIFFDLPTWFWHTWKRERFCCTVQIIRLFNLYLLFFSPYFSTDVSRNYTLSLVVKSVIILFKAKKKFHLNIKMQFLRKNQFFLCNSCWK